MPAKLCTGVSTQHGFLLKESKAYCEGMKFRASGTAAAKPITGNPDDGLGTALEAAWDAGWNFADGKSIPFELTGTIDPAASTDVVGVNTLFETELVVGDSITVTGETRVVATITDDTNLTVTLAFTDNANDTTPQRVRALPFDTSATCCNLGGVVSA